MHGAQRSSAAQLSWGRSVMYCATCGTHTDKHTPSAPLSDLQLGGLAPFDLIKVSGTQEPPLHALSCEATAGTNRSVGTQCAAPVVQHDGRVATSSGAAGVGVHAPGSVD